jgi:hypothetical protein
MRIRKEVHIIIRLSVYRDNCLTNCTTVRSYGCPAILALVHTAICPLQRIANQSSSELILCPVAYRYGLFHNSTSGWVCSELFTCLYFYLSVSFYNRSFVCLYSYLFVRPVSRIVVPSILLQNNIEKLADFPCQGRLSSSCTGGVVRLRKRFYKHAKNPL